MCALVGGLVALGPEQPVEPALALGREGRRALDSCAVDRPEYRAEEHALLRLVARDRLGDPRDVRLELVAVCEQRPSLVVEACRHREHGLAERGAARVVRLDGQPGLGRADRKLLPVPGDASREQRVLERVLALRELPP